MNDNQIILNILKEHHNYGLSITDLVAISQLPRSRVRTILARFDGSGKLKIRRIGMAKLHRLKSEKD